MLLAVSRLVNRGAKRGYRPITKRVRVNVDPNLAVIRAVGSTVQLSVGHPGRGEGTQLDGRQGEDAGGEIRRILQSV